MPRAYVHPDHLITEDTCVIIGGDASNCGWGDASWQVKIGDARLVNIPDDLTDPALSTLFDLKYTALSEAMQTWLTFETEMGKIVDSLKRKAGMLIRATQGFVTDKSHPDYKVKVLAFTDSAFSKGTAEHITVPTGKVDFAAAKARKLACWAEDICWTRDIPMEFAGIPGQYNHLCDFLSHMSDAMVTLDREARQLETADDLRLRMNCAITRHSFHVAAEQQQTETQNSYPEPAGWRVEYLNLDEVGWKEVIRAYKHDSQEIHKVPMKSIYKALTGDSTDLSTLEKERTESWVEKIFAISVCEDGEPALFVPASFLRIDEDDDNMPVTPDLLVALIPAGAKVKVTTAANLYDNVTEDELQFLSSDLRSDIILLAHDYSLHARWEEMLCFIRKFGYWHTLVKDIRAHIASCCYCLAKAKAHRLSGFGLVAQAIFRHIGMDHLVLPDWLKEITGCQAILTIDCRACGEMEMATVETVGATDTGVALFNRWIRTRGVPRTATSDHGLDMKALDIVMRLTGIQVHGLTSVADSRALGSTESRNNAGQLAIEQLGASGDVRCRADLEVYLTKTCMKRNMITETAAGHTVFERTRGYKPRTAGDWLVTTPDVIAEAEALSGESAEEAKRVIALMASRTEELLQAHRETRDQRARRSAMNRDQTAARQVAVAFDLRKGDTVSYENTKKQQKTGTLVNVTEYANKIPITAEVKLLNGPVVPVQYSALKPAGTPRSALLVTDITEQPLPGKLSLFNSSIYGEERICGGIITNMAADTQSFTVHVHACSESGRSWMPSWQKTGKKTQSQKACPEGFAAYSIRVDVDQVEMYGKLKPSYLVTEETFDKMRVKGLVQ